MTQPSRIDECNRQPPSIFSSPCPLDGEISHRSPRVFLFALKPFVRAWCSPIFNLDRSALPVSPPGYVSLLSVIRPAFCIVHGEFWRALRCRLVHGPPCDPYFCTRTPPYLALSERCTQFSLTDHCLLFSWSHFACSSFPACFPVSIHKGCALPPPFSDQQSLSKCPFPPPSPFEYFTRAPSPWRKLGEGIVSPPSFPTAPLPVPFFASLLSFVTALNEVQPFPTTKPMSFFPYELSHFEWRPGEFFLVLPQARFERQVPLGCSCVS